MLKAWLAVLFWWVVAACAWAQDPPPIAAFGRLPALADVALSPNGQRIAVAFNDANGAAVAIYDVAKSPMERVMAARLSEGERARGVGWAGDRFATAVVARTFRTSEVTAAGWVRRGPQRYFDYERVATIDLETGRVRLMMMEENASWAVGGLADLTAPIAGDPEHGRMTAPMAPGVDARLGAYRVNLRTGDGVIAERFDENTWDVLFDARGRAVARTEADERTNRWRLFARAGEDWREIATGVSDIGAPPPLLGTLEDGRIVSSDREGEKRTARLITYDPATGAVEPLVARPPFDVFGAIVDPVTHHVVGASWTGAMVREQHFLDEDLAAASNALKAVVGDAFHRITSWSADRAKVIVLLEGAAPQWLLYDRATGTLREIGRMYPDLKPADLGDTALIEYPARDGVRVPGYLTLPPGVTAAKALPAVLLVHGGPASRDSAAFDWWAQHLASRGYAVLQPNFRGSSGYGLDWEDAGHGQWGGLMQTDAEDMVLALGRAGMIDPARVCIVGDSYGGYAALAGATLTPERYRCAASVNGVADLVDMLTYDIRNTSSKSASADYWRLSIGNLREDRGRIAAVSPAEHAAAVKAPILLVHGTRDWIVPISQARTMRSRLEAAGKPVEFVELAGDDHFLSTPQTRMQMLETVEAFLQRHNPARP